MARTCSQAEFGLFALGMTIILLLLDVQASLVSTPQAIRSAGIKGKTLEIFTGSTLTHQFILSVLCTGALGTAAILLSVIGTEAKGLLPVLGTIALFAAFTLLREYWRRFCFLRNWMVKMVTFDGGIAFTQVAALWAVAYLGRASASAAHATWDLFVPAL